MISSPAWAKIFYSTYFFCLHMHRSSICSPQNQTLVSFMTLSSLPDYFRLLWSDFICPLSLNAQHEFYFSPPDELPCTEHCDLLTVQASKQCSALLLRFTGWMSESCSVLLLLNDSVSLCCRIWGWRLVVMGEQRALSRIPSDRRLYVVRAWWNRWRMPFSYIILPKFHSCGFFFCGNTFFLN